jgi:hypothetical protein
MPASFTKSNSQPNARRLFFSRGERGFVTSKYEISEGPRSKGKALRVYTATDKVAEVKAKLKKGL